MANEEQLKILKQGVNTWNQWRHVNLGVRANLSAANLSAAKLIDADLSRARLSGADLSKADLWWANLSEADLSKARLSGADLSKADLWWANLSGANISEADLSYANLSGADLVGADLSKARLSGADLSKADLWWANLSGANLSHANLSYANLSHANFSGAQIDDATQIDDKWRFVWEIVNKGAQGRDLRKADLSEANLSGANLRAADLSGANLMQANLSGANLSGAQIDDATQIDDKWRFVWEIVNKGAQGRDLRKADLSGANLMQANLSGANLSGADLVGADLSKADLSYANLSKADLSYANLSGANLSHANLRGTQINDATQIDDKWRLVWEIVNKDAQGRDLRKADLSEANLMQANLSGANLTGANASGANLSMATLVKTNLTEANLTNSRIYGISAWDLNLTGAIQRDLIVTPEDQPTVTVDNLEVAQFIYLLLHNEKIREVIDTMTSKAVLILGRFTPERKAILDSLRDALRQQNYVPILFDFDKPTNEDFTGTIKTLAGMCHFVIADITNPKSSPLELQATVPDYMIPFVPIIQEDEQPFAMFQDLWIRHREWVLPLLQYGSEEDLIDSLEDDIIKPAKQRFAELTLRKNQEMLTRSTSHRKPDKTAILNTQNQSKIETSSS